jgi:glycosyltransferase involved in cell wall biosynthesis
MEQATVDVSVVIPVRNAADHLEEQLAALASQTYEGSWEVVVADNGSTDASLEVVRSWALRVPHLEIVDASDRAGPSHARNVGAAAARGRVLAFVDADDVAAPTWLAELVAAAAGATWWAVLSTTSGSTRRQPGDGAVPPARPTRRRRSASSPSH